MEKDQSMVSAFMVSYDQLVVAIISLYFLTVSRYWLGLFLIQTVLNALALLCALAMLPESPKWLLSKGRRQEAIESLNRVAEVNLSDVKITENSHFAESSTSGPRNEGMHSTSKLTTNLLIMCTMFLFINLAYFIALFMSSAFEG
jgi:hypothetical protein